MSVYVLLATLSACWYIAFMLATNSHMQLYVLLMHKYDLIFLVYLIYLDQSKFQYIYTTTLLQPLKT